MDSIAFYEELIKNLSNETDDINSCLISGEDLDESHIKLECNHRFNYNYIYNEILQQKTQINTLEVQRLRVNQIKCPYCRNVQDSLLPQRSNYDTISGVNKPTKFCMMTNKCSTILKSGKRKGTSCDKLCMEKFCNYHKNNEKEEDIILCSAILKSGKRKGESCNKKTKQNGFCLTHSKMN